MYNTILTLHSYWAYLVLFILIIAVGNALFKTFGDKEYSAKDFRISLFTLINLNQAGPNNAPENPAIIIAKGVIELSPCNCSVKVIPTGVVTDFSDKATAIFAWLISSIVNEKLTVITMQTPKAIIANNSFQ